MKILLSWSSGKDSAWALHLLNEAHPGTDLVRRGTGAADRPLSINPSGTA